MGLAGASDKTGTASCGGHPALFVPDTSVVLSGSPNIFATRSRLGPEDFDNMDWSRDRVPVH